jgi:hypothetical protein
MLQRNLALNEPLNRFGEIKMNGDTIYAVNATPVSINAHAIAPDGRIASAFNLIPSQGVQFSGLEPVLHAICAFDSATNDLVHLGKARPGQPGYDITQNQFASLSAREAPPGKAIVQKVGYGQRKNVERRDRATEIQAAVAGALDELHFQDLGPQHPGNPVRLKVTPETIYYLKTIENGATIEVNFKGVVSIVP